MFHQKNLGIAKTINDGLRNCNGNLSHLLPSDDLWMEDKLEKQLKILEDENLIVCVTQAIIDDAS